MANSKLRPYWFLIIALAISESFLIIWMALVATTTPATERIVVGSLSIAVLISVLVVYCVITWINTISKIEDTRINTISKIEDTKMKHDLGDHGIGTTMEKDAETEWPAGLLYYDTGSKLWYYNSDDNAPNSVTWTQVEYG